MDVVVHCECRPGSLRTCRPPSFIVSKPSRYSALAHLFVNQNSANWFLGAGTLRNEVGGIK